MYFMYSRRVGVRWGFVVSIRDQFAEDRAHLPIFGDRKRFHEAEELGFYALAQWLLLPRLRFPFCCHRFSPLVLVKNRNADFSITGLKKSKGRAG
jgi:hypothetical protein